MRAHDAAKLLDWIARYILRFNFAVTPLRGKAPYLDGWNHEANLIRTIEQAHECFRPGDNAGVVLEPSRLVSLDADHEATETVLAAEGIDLQKLIERYPTITGRRPRIEFRAPVGIRLEKKVVRWPKPEDPTGPGKITILEFRA